jgi:hypothetical protein
MQHFDGGFEHTEPREWHCELCGFHCSETYYPTYEDIAEKRYGLREAIIWWRERAGHLGKRRITLLRKALKEESPDA